ncbi:MAG: dicarboxylate/amino acid:cation symporter [Treponema sp.]|nr:dicarboxylate/amino acid:cation symporter [Treponema sp.]
MKIWFKYLIAVLLGIAAAYILPTQSLHFTSALHLFTELFTRFGCYILLPLLFSSVIISFYKLIDNKQLFKMFAWTGIIILCTTAAFTFIGLCTGLIIPLPRIPISDAKITSVDVLNIPDMLRMLFPYSTFTTLTQEHFLLPCFIFGGLIGIASYFDKVSSKQVIQFADSFSKVCYQILIFFMEVLSIGIIALTTSWIIEYRAVLQAGVFTPLIIMLSTLLLIITILVYPLILHFVFKDPHPYRVLYASIAPLLVSFLSGNTNLSLPLIIRESKDSLGIRRRQNGITCPVFAIFARGGSALTTTICFIIIWRSYSSLSITPSELIWLAGTSFGLSFLLGMLPAGGSFFSLTILCTLYSRGFETGYLLLKPVAVIIGSFAAAFDTITVMYCNYFISIKMKMSQHKEIKRFI